VIGAASHFSIQWSISMRDLHSTYSHFITVVRCNLKISQHLHVYNCWHVNSVQHQIYGTLYDPSPHKSSHAKLQIYINYHRQTNAKYRFLVLVLRVWRTNLNKLHIFWNFITIQNSMVLF
jgi:hypothetical protein